MKIVVADDLPASALDLLRAEADWTIASQSDRTPDDLATALADADALMVRSATKVDQRLLAAAPRLHVQAQESTTSMS
jgi:D-3-phosphoglycerate dehydrogenase / 2-oxoglutarate reductase